MAGNSPLTSSAFVRLLDRRLTKVFNNFGSEFFPELPSQIGEFFDVMTTDSAFEEFFSIGAVPDIPPFNGKLTYLSVSPGFYTKIEPREFAGGMQFERKLIDDEKYGVFTNRTIGLKQSATRTREKEGVGPFARAFSTVFDYQVSEEGVALCSSAHLTKAGVSTTTGFANAGTSALSKTSIAATRLAMRRFRNDIGERIDVSDELGIVVPDSLADAAYEIINTPKSLGTAEGNVNPQYQRYKIMPWRRLDDTSTSNWFMVDIPAMKRSLKFLDRIKADLNNTVDFETYIWKASTYFRLAWGFCDWRWIYGHSIS